MHRWASLFAASVALAAAGCSRPEATGWQGYLEGEYVYVSAPAAGKVERLDVERGASVAAGAPLFALESEPERSARAEQAGRLDQARARLLDLGKGSRPSELAAAEARLNAARSRLDLAEAQLRRARALRATSVVPQEDLDRAETERQAAAETVAQNESELATLRLGGREDALRAAEADVAAAVAHLAQLDWTLAEKTQTAPTAALVTDVLHRVGERTGAGAPVVQLLPPANVKVRFFVPPQTLAGIRIGDAVEVRVTGGGQGFPARVVHIAPRAEFTPPVIYSRETAHKLVHLVEAAPDRPDPALLHPGLPVEVRLSP
jgi:HlyD family secretion protein